MFGSKANAARTATKQIIDLRGTLRYMGVPLRDTSYMFGDNKTGVDSGSLGVVNRSERAANPVQSSACLFFIG